jgi:hypothetical protein
VVGAVGAVGRRQWDNFLVTDGDARERTGWVMAENVKM